MEQLLLQIQGWFGLTAPWQAGVVAAGAALLVVLPLIWLLLRGRRRVTLDQTLAQVSYQRMTDVVLPKADDGEIVVEHILLTERGILVVEARDIRGVVFGGDRMHDWTVMHEGRRFTMANPQAGLYDRVAAVKQVVKDVPVEGRIVFGGEADFSKGVPSHVCTEKELLAELPKVRGKTGSQTRHAFDNQWQSLRDAAFDWQDRGHRSITPTS
ncbi:MAG: nuclease-related domain-containing protein [Pseudomonadota bacterium]